MLGVSLVLSPRLYRPGAGPFDFLEYRPGRFRESDLFRHLFEAVLARCIAEGLAGGESFGADASLIKADASRYKMPDFSLWSAEDGASLAKQEYLDTLDGERMNATR